MYPHLVEKIIPWASLFAFLAKLGLNWRRNPNPAVAKNEAEEWLGIG